MVDPGCVEALEWLFNDGRGIQERGSEKKRISK